jgi:glycosyltransferase involved in cell wall biosynthesis
MTTPDASPLTVWLLPSDYAPRQGGIETVTAHFARELRDRGHRVLVVTNRHPRDLPAEEVVDGTRVVRVAYAARRRTPGGAARFVRDRRASRSLIGALEPAPDVIHVHGVSTQADAALHAAHRLGARLVVTTHGEITADAHGLYTKEHVRRTLREVLAAAAAVTAPSQWVVSESERVDLPLPEGTTIVPNGLDVDDWRRVPEAPEGPHVALAWGRDSPEKGLRRLPEAWSAVRRSLPDAELTIIGPGGSGNAFWSDAAGRPGVRVLPAASPEEIRRHLAGARVVVVPSVFEAYGLVALEALAAGRTVVYSAGTGMDETVGPHGIAADADDPDALGAAIVTAFTAPPPPAAPLHLFRSWSDVADDYLAIYRRVCSA